MTSTWSQVRSIAGTDLRLRLRRPATLWLVLALSWLAYLLIPDPSGGMALMVVDGARALYTSQVVALATAGLASIMLTFAGFYLASNTIRRELLARTGGIIAATPVGSGTYLVGKWLGGAGYLGLVTLIYMANVMAMHLLRGEGPLQPLTYLATYLLALGPAILVVSALALCFECVPLLSGRLGDVAYFFLWMVMLAMGAIGEGSGPGQAVDVLGIGFIMHQVNAVSNSTQLALGMTPFDPRLAPWVLPPIPFSIGVLLPRLTTALLAVPVLVVARLGFHRFDPATVKSDSQSSGGHLIRRLSMLVKPLTGPVSRAGERFVPTAPGALRPVLAETVMTLCQSPLVLAAWLGVLVATVVSTAETAHHRLPLIIAVILAVALADLSTRDRAAGTLPMLYGMPRIKPDYAWIKFGGAALLALLFCLPLAVRIAITAPGAALSLLIAAGFMAALATALGLLSRTPKAFMGLFLLFLYLVLNGAQVPALDFAGWNGVATDGTRADYFAATVILAVLAAAKHRWDLAREGA
jgi:hypothetical protein